MVGSNRRAALSDYYRSKGDSTWTLLEKAAASASQYAYRGDQVTLGAVVRVDLNGYSAWAADHSLRERVDLLDAFFSVVVPKLNERRGIFFRDEGDCIVGVFSPYFGMGFEFDWVVNFARDAARETYGTPGLSAKVTVATHSQVAFFQKAHERGSSDWSAEGQPFVNAARLEQAIPSKRRIYFDAAEYDHLYTSSVPIVTSGSPYYWRLEREKLQVPGLGLPGGWTELVYLEYIPGGAR